MLPEDWGHFSWEGFQEDLRKRYNKQEALKKEAAFKRYEDSVKEAVSTLQTELLVEYKEDVQHRYEGALVEAARITSTLKACPHCGAKAKLIVEIWGSSGEDRLGAFVSCEGAPHSSMRYFPCNARGLVLQESPGFLEAVAAAWDKRV